MTGAVKRGLILFAPAAALSFFGWRLFWFLCDDAFIEFRYASNLLSGRGLVWNPAPFMPVEGYTSWSWVMLLAGVWKVLGVEPPDAANVLSLLFGLASLAVVVVLLLRLELPLPLSALALLGMVTNRTWLTWLSSGLETSLFDFTVLLWVLAAVLQKRSLWLLASAAAACTLTRPDGWLLWLGTLAIALGARSTNALTNRALAGLSPLLLPVVHLLWRHGFYGEWVPNTFYAKAAGAWPEAGLRYLFCFLLENGGWLVLALAAEWMVRHWRRRAELQQHFAPAVVVLTLAAHLAYYTLVIGGDHFEYRIFAHLIPLQFVAAAWLAPKVFTRFSLAAAGFVVLGSWPLGWVHWLKSKDITRHEELMPLVVPVAPSFPPGLNAIAGVFDAQQEWLIRHLVCQRHQQHKMIRLELSAQLPPRSEGSKVSWDSRPIQAWGVVGVMGWTFPNLGIIDTLGLNDRVVAHGPIVDENERKMAHDRMPPPGYVECFRPNFMVGNPWREVPRDPPLTDDDIRRCESSFAGGTR